MIQTAQIRKKICATQTRPLACLHTFVLLTTCRIQGDDNISCISKSHSCNQAIISEVIHNNFKGQSPSSSPSVTADTPHPVPCWICSLHHSPSQSHTGSAAGRGHRLEESQAPRWARCHAEETVDGREHSNQCHDNRQ